MSLNYLHSYRFPKRACWLKALLHKTSSGSLLFSTIGVGLTTITWLGFSDLGVTLEICNSQFASNYSLYERSILAESLEIYPQIMAGMLRPYASPIKLAQTPTSRRNQVTRIFVNPAADGNGDGSESTPLKTITQALQVAAPNTIITLAAGTYGTDSGETFPLKLKPDVTIQGDSKTRGSNIVIKGGGTFISPTFARQDVAILGAERASLIGVTVTNPNPRGYALWIESSSPTVSDNTFTGSNHDGISITGKSSPVIRNNYFYKNGANGITIYGTSQAQVRENVFEQTGFGINIAQKAAPLIISNRIIRNRAGVVAQANSKPVLRNNLVEGNTEDGLVAIAFSQPDLGTKEQPGGNEFRQNGRYDINSSAAKQAIVAVGNQLARDRLVGKIDLAGTGTPTVIAANQPPLEAREQRSLPSRGAEELPKVGGETTLSTPTSSPSPSLIAPPTTSTSPSPSPSLSFPDSTALAPIEISVPPPESGEQAAPKPTEQVEPKPSNEPEKLSFVPITELQDRINVSPASNSKPLVAEVTTPAPAAKPTARPPSTAIAPPPAAKPTARPRAKNGSLTQGLPVLAPAPINPSELLPVPNANIPIGNNRNQRQQLVVGRNSLVPAAESPPQPPTSLATAMGLRYRVVVEAENESTQAKVRLLVPGAFRIFTKGRVFMQAGAYSDRAEADEMLQLLTGNGLKAKVEEIN